tara:strand:+ start:77 stop:286 length:210 start_codon:yes stop_codon:yes gene_type:complete
MTKLLMRSETAYAYVDMDADQFDRFIRPWVTGLKFDDDVFYLAHQLDDAVYSLIEGSPTRTGFEPYLVE